MCPSNCLHDSLHNYINIAYQYEAKFLYSVWPEITVEFEEAAIYSVPILSIMYLI